jgi:DNA polymerase II large subunit
MGFKDFRFFDDNLDNLEYAKQLEDEYDVRVETKHIIDKWIPRL